MKFEAITFTYEGHDKIEAETNRGQTVWNAISEASKLARLFRILVVLDYNDEKIEIGPRAKPENVILRWSRRHNGS